MFHRDEFIIQSASRWNRPPPQAGLEHNSFLISFASRFSLAQHSVGHVWQRTEG